MHVQRCFQGHRCTSVCKPRVLVVAVGPPWLLGAITAGPSRGTACMGTAAWQAPCLLWTLLGRCVLVQLRQYCHTETTHFHSDSCVTPTPNAGAVAVLCTLRLLRGLGDNAAQRSVRCITFGMPAIGNAALANHVSLLGWHHCFTSFVLPGASACR